MTYSSTLMLRQRLHRPPFPVPCDTACQAGAIRLHYRTISIGKEPGLAVDLIIKMFLYQDEDNE